MLRLVKCYVGHTGPGLRGPGWPGPWWTPCPYVGQKVPTFESLKAIRGCALPHLNCDWRWLPISAASRWTKVPLVKFLYILVYFGTSVLFRFSAFQSSLCSVLKVRCSSEFTRVLQAVAQRLRCCCLQRVFIRGQLKRTGGCANVRRSSPENRHTYDARD